MIRLLFYSFNSNKITIYGTRTIPIPLNNHYYFFKKLIT
jgi:hypothetical protein